MGFSFNFIAIISLWIRVPRPQIMLLFKLHVSVGVFESLLKWSGVTGQTGWCHSSDLLLHYCGVTGQVQL